MIKVAAPNGLRSSDTDTRIPPPLFPILKWPGGKRWFVHSHADFLPRTYNTYIEPFLGAASVYLHLRPERALLGDINSDLITAYQSIRDNWRQVRSSLKYRQRRHNEDSEGYYYWLRDRNPATAVQQASRLIYLNRTCFNGIYRVNREGQFNVPRGTKDKVVLGTDDFEAFASLLKSAELIAGDFESLVDRAKEGDLVFCDPPYTVRHNYNGFRKYNEVLFSWSDQQRLRDALFKAAQRGAKIVCTNANHDSIHDLYHHQTFDLDVVSRISTISADPDSRSNFEELIIRANT